MSLWGLLKYVGGFSPLSLAKWFPEEMRDGGGVSGKE